MKELTSLLVVGAVLTAAAAVPAGERKSELKLRRVSAVESLWGGRSSLAYVQEPMGPGRPYGPMPVSPHLVPVPEPSGDYLYGSPMSPLPPVGGPPLGGPPLTFTGDHCPCELFACVEYEDRDHIHPCAVKQVVAVRDPRASCDPCGPRGCVYVVICAPPDCCPKVKVKDDGRKVEYDYGDYQVEIESKKGKVFVDYDD